MTATNQHRRLERLAFPLRASLTARILAVNILALALLGGGLFFLDSYRRQLLEERFQLAQSEAQISADALAGAARERQEDLLRQIGQDQQLRLRVYDRDGALLLDSFELGPPSFTLIDPQSEPWYQHTARLLDIGMDWMVGAAPIPPYREHEGANAEDFEEVVQARTRKRTQMRLRYAPDRTPMITAAAPMGTDGKILLITRNAIDITQDVRDARQTLAIITALAIFISVQLSLYLARTIVKPLRQLVRATVRVRLGRERAVEVPRMTERRDEIGLLARAVSDMTSALRERIDAGESFAADVAHEIKNPLASLRSALESLRHVEDTDLRDRLMEIAAHDVRRIDRLITEIAEASRIDAELSRAVFERVDLASLVENVVRSREDRGGHAGLKIHMEQSAGDMDVLGVPLRIERVVENLLENAVSFSPPGGSITLSLARMDGMVRLEVVDDGPGIPEAERGKVFERFHSLRPESENFGDHSGLGLAIARTIAEAHDGHLTAQSRSNNQPGARLVLELPAA
ncbi:stimulus-sensing domain-containing protein [Altericroceibacterium endophyticum]|uniref:histidine kinase n=1 Tax=Altericroceibacterium endophyticum TaxID=1808508 RepID=A0A6I4SZK6_9SPHN|nr:stimulus-sensing domain-containing protein [Altericroceibacterium endophyticum]MXO64214.1 HAMP domain-containing protein [Altericroceibacterium endophyticum]